MAEVRTLIRVRKTALNSWEKYAEFGYFVLLFYKERQKTAQRIITHAYTAIVLAAVGAQVCLFSALADTKLMTK